MFALGQRRLWEGTMCIWRRHHGLYPALKRREDSAFVRNLTACVPVAQIQAPHLYCYVVTGKNTWNTAHFETLFANAEQTFTGASYDTMMARLAARMPITQYDRALQAMTAPGGPVSAPD